MSWIKLVNPYWAECEILLEQNTPTNSAFCLRTYHRSQTAIYQPQAAHVFKIAYHKVKHILWIERRQQFPSTNLSSRNNQASLDGTNSIVWLWKVGQNSDFLRWLDLSSHWYNICRGVARHNFKRRQLSPPLPKNGSPGVYPDFF